MTGTHTTDYFLSSISYKLFKSYFYLTSNAYSKVLHVKEFVRGNNVHSVGLSPLTKVLLDKNPGILDPISSPGGVSQLYRETLQL